MTHIPTRMTVRLRGRSTHLPMNFSMDATNQIRACSDTQLPMDLLIDVEKSRGIFKILVQISKEYQ